MKKTLLIIIVIVGFIVRIWQLGSVPVSPDWDEASLGYNAYSILHTGRDEFGQFLPLILRSFDDYKPALYAYLAIPSIAIFGLNTFAVRLPSALLGTLAIVLMYGITRLLLKRQSKYEYIALLSAASLALMPWHIQFSRVAFEAQSGLTLALCGLFFFLKAFEKPRYYYISAFFWALTVYTYQGEKVLVPLLLVTLLVLFKDTVRKNKKHVLYAGVVWILIIFPFYYATLSNPEALLRARGVSIFADQTHFLQQSTERLSVDQANSDIVGSIFDNRRVAYALGVVDAYLSHYDLGWLFISGDIARHQPPEFGHLYLWLLPFLLLGIYEFYFSSVSRKTKLFVTAWVLISPIPASITTGVPHPVRTIHFIPMFALFIGFGMYRSITWLRSNSRKYLTLSLSICILAFVIFETAFYLDQYFIQYNYQSSKYWQDGYEEAVPFVQNLASSYNHIVVSNSPPLEQSYMFFLYYLRYDPKKYQEEGGTSSGGYAEENNFSNYSFRPIHWDEDHGNSSTLFVGPPSEIPDQARILHTVYYLNGEVAIRIAAGD